MTCHLTNITFPPLCLIPNADPITASAFSSRLDLNADLAFEASCDANPASVIPAPVILATLFPRLLFSRLTLKTRVPMHNPSLPGLLPYLLSNVFTR